MKAAVCTKYGSPEVIEIQEIKKPVPKGNELLVKVITTVVSVGDSRIRAFRVPSSYWIPARLMLGIWKPRQPVFGVVFSGIVESTGGKVTQFKVGDAVLGYKVHKMVGAHAEYTCIGQEECVMLKPANLSFEEAVAVPWGALTSFYFFEQRPVRKGDKVLVYGASGSVGLQAVQLAKISGAEVTGVCSTANLALVKSVGADHVLDYTRDNVFAEKEKYDIVFEAVDKTRISDCLSLLKKGGVLLHAVATPEKSIIMKFLASLQGKKAVGGTFVPKRKNLEYLMDFASRGLLKPIIDKIYSLEEIREAHAHVDTGHKRGEVVLRIGKLG